MDLSNNKAAAHAQSDKKSDNQNTLHLGHAALKTDESQQQRSPAPSQASYGGNSVQEFRVSGEAASQRENGAANSAQHPESAPITVNSSNADVDRICTEPLLDKFQLRMSVLGHSADIRCVTVGVQQDREILITGSRDKTCRICKQDGRLVFPTGTISVHENYVAAVIFVSPTPQYPTGLIVTGSNDMHIRAFVPDELEQPKYRCVGHEGTVCAFAYLRGTLVSGSWDKTARLWQGPNHIATLTGHDAAIWAVAFLPNHNNSSFEIGTASADATIRLWDQRGQHLHTIKEGHSQAVRALKPVPSAPGTFLSAGNDNLIIYWDLRTRSALKTFTGHTNYIYCLAVLRPQPGDTAGYFASGGEDGTLRIWHLERDNEPIQTIHLPAKSIWGVTGMKQGDVAVGCSDCTLRVFTRHPELVAPANESHDLKRELAGVQHSAKEVLANSGINIDDLPGEEKLLEPGTREGQTRMIRRGDFVTIYSWDSTAEQWTQIGEVVGAGEKGATQAPGGGKTTYEGVEYDYVFSVDIQEDSPPLKLPYNLDQDPWMAAHNFIELHMLSALYLDQIANFIIRNAPGAGGLSSSTNTTTDNDADYSDPITGGSRYIPKS